NVRIAFDGNTHSLSYAHDMSVAFRDFGAQSQRVVPHNGDHRRAGNKIFADACTFLLHDSVERRIDGCVGELWFGNGEFGAALREHSLTVAYLFERVLMTTDGYFKRSLCGIEIGLRNQSFFKQ